MRSILVVGTSEAARDFADQIARVGWGLNLLGFVATEIEAPRTHDMLGSMADLPRLLDEGAADDVVIADPVSNLAALQEAIQCCEEVGVAVHIPSHFFRAALSRPHLETFSNIPMLTFSTTPYSPVALAVKRALDIILGLGLFLAAALPMLAFAIAIKLTSKGPVIFRQTRSGLYGRPFTFYKFRSMVMSAEDQRGDLDSENIMDGPVFKMRDDPRITSVGRWMRKYSLDELPQLWNVLKGNMSLIGPRPPLPSEVEKYERWQRRRLSMRPGLTCIWQVTDRNLTPFEKWMEYDLRYIDNWSLWLDFKIALQTIPAVLKGTGL